MFKAAGSKESESSEVAECSGRVGKVQSKRTSGKAYLGKSKVKVGDESNLKDGVNEMVSAAGTEDGHDKNPERCFTDN